MTTEITLESKLQELEEAKDNVKWLLEHPEGLASMHGIAYWSGRVESLRGLIKNSL